jgi:hypothetical protein
LRLHVRPIEFVEARPSHKPHIHSRSRRTCRAPRRRYRRGRRVRALLVQRPQLTQHLVEAIHRHDLEVAADGVGEFADKGMKVGWHTLAHRAPEDTVAEVVGRRSLLHEQVAHHRRLAAAIAHHHEGMIAQQWHELAHEVLV